MKAMKIISWNINGLRAVIKKDFHGFLKKEKPDVLCLQEIKIDAEAIKKELFDFEGYDEYYNPAERKGYSGTAVLVKTSPPTSSPNQERGLLPKFKWDDEGRVQVLDMDKFYLINIYFPNSNHELSRLDFKIKFNNKLLKEFKKLEKKKPLVICGDYNVAHNEIDLARPKENVGNPGFHPREREWMDKFLQAGFVDTFRTLHPEEIKYSWWSYRAGARRRNVGWRIDYFCVSKSIKNNIKKAFIMNEVMGSDHCPVGVEIA
jgi:exodeoxyribonuclease-3